MNDDQSVRSADYQVDRKVGRKVDRKRASDEEADARKDAGDGSTKPPRRRWSSLTEMVALFAIALTIALLVKTFVVQPFFIPSGSMENTLLMGDKVLVNKLVYHVRPIGRGDIVVFNGTGSWDLPAPSPPASRNLIVRGYDDTIGALIRSIAGLFGSTPTQIDYIKRVIGVPGDHVVCCNSRGQITVNGVALSEKSYLYPGAKPSASRFSIVVPPGRLWVMGDHRNDSADSRFHDCAYANSEIGVQCLAIDRDGTIPENKVIGRAFMIVWPPGRFRVLPIPSTFDQARLTSSGQGMASYLALGAGLGFAVPVTLAQRRLRRRLRRQLRGRVSRRHGR